MTERSPTECTPAEFTLNFSAWSDGGVIPDRFAFGRPGTDGPFATSDNISPAISWTGAPAATQSFVVVMHDIDVPSSGEDVNQAGKTVPADLPRVPFYHWLQINIPASVSHLPEGTGGTGVTARGKPIGAVSMGTDQIGLTGQNDYTGWFANDPDMSGTYGGYDGPCPPWNDSIIHRYYVTVYALDIPALNKDALNKPDSELSGPFTGEDVLAAMEGHILAQQAVMGTYAMNPDLR